MATRGKVSGSQSPLSPLVLASSQPKRKKRVQVSCPICEEIIEDATSKKSGHDAIFCDGTCQDWLHRRCAGLSKVNFAAAKSSDEPFFCPCCLLAEKSKELSSLKATVDELVVAISNLSTLRDTVSALSGDLGSLQSKFTSVGLLSDNSSSQLHQQSISSSAPLPTHSAFPQHPPPATAQPTVSKTINVQDRKYNVVVFGVLEMPKGSSRSVRANHDFSRLTAIFSDLETTSDHKSSIRDCRRLGKYVHSDTSSRPLLVTLNSTADVRNILHHHNNSSDTSISIKPDLPASVRKANAILLKQRWSLINSGFDRKSIRIHGQELFVNGQLHGMVSGSVFVPNPSTSKSLPSTPASSVPSNPASSVPLVSASDRSSANFTASSNTTTSTITLDSVDPPSNLNKSSRPSVSDKENISPPPSQASSD